MLQSLHIRDLALIAEAEVEFSPGLNVVSGETGSGKSLLVTAVKLLRGERVTGNLVRHGADALRVDAEFALGSGERSETIAGILAERCGSEPTPDDGALLVTRIVDAKGRSRVRINDRPATLAALRELGPWLLEVHGQDESRALMRPEIQAETLDAFAGTAGLRSAFADALARARASHQALERSQAGDRERLARVEFLRFQLRELEQLDLQPGEIAELEREHAVLGNLDHLREQLRTASDALQDGEPSAAELLSRAERALLDAAEIDPELRAAAEATAEARLQVTEAAREVQSSSGRLDLDPARLAEVENRLASVRQALSRFGATEDALFAQVAAMRTELDTLEDPGRSAVALEQQHRSDLDELGAVARKLTRARSRASKRFSEAIVHELRDLAMEQTRFRVAMADPDPSRLLEESTAHGPTPLDFEVCINPGEPFHSMRETASGGEMARIVLAVKKCLADQDRVPFLAFDEIDAEIGGRLGLSVGQVLREVALHHQVLIVTHLPQVAAFAHAHFAVGKQTIKGRTTASVTALDERGVERELAAMSAGEGADQAAIREARRLVAKVREHSGD